MYKKELCLLSLSLLLASITAPALAAETEEVSTTIEASESENPENMTEAEVLSEYGETENEEVEVISESSPSSSESVSQNEENPDSTLLDTENIPEEISLEDASAEISYDSRLGSYQISCQSDTLDKSAGTIRDVILITESESYSLESPELTVSGSVTICFTTEDTSSSSIAGIPGLEGITVYIIGINDLLIFIFGCAHKIFLRIGDT